jgi:hypothetical protein
MADTNYEPYVTREDLAQMETRLVDRMGQIETRLVDRMGQMDARSQQMETRIVERLARLEGHTEGQAHQLVSHDARLLSLENWMRTFMVAISVVALGVAVQIVLTLVKHG